MSFQVSLSISLCFFGPDMKELRWSFKASRTPVFHFHVVVAVAVDAEEEMVQRIAHKTRRADQKILFIRCNDTL